MTFRGFAVCNSGTQVTEEAAGIKLSGDRHIVEGNDIRDVYFGIHIGNGAGQVVRGNRIVPGERHGARRCAHPCAAARGGGAMTIEAFLAPEGWMNPAGGPLYGQLRRRIESGIASGLLAPDMALPRLKL